MNIIMWVLAGSAIGWAGFALLEFNEKWGMIVSIVIGAMGGFVGGKVLAPMLGAAAAVSGDFSIHALIIAVMSAATCLAIGNLIHNRFGV